MNLNKSSYLGESHGWTIYGHPLLIDQLIELTKEVKKLKNKHPESYTKYAATKRLIAINNLMYKVIPQNPTSANYRQGATLGKANKHWFRAKFGMQYRLFFRFHQASKTIIFTWVNDESTKRAYGSKTDAYKVFGDMLDSGYPPGDWDELLAQVKK